MSVAEVVRPGDNLILAGSSNEILFAIRTCLNQTGANSSKILPAQVGGFSGILKSPWAVNPDSPSTWLEKCEDELRRPLYSGRRNCLRIF